MFLGPDVYMADELSPENQEESLAEYREAFATFDQDDDGYITVEEVESVMKKLGIDANREDIEERIRLADKDGNGRIDFTEFSTMMIKQRKETKTNHEFRAAFNVFDKDGNGYISLSELGEVMKSLDESLTEVELKEMLREADIDGDGQVDFDEFVKLIEPTSQR